VFILRVYKDIKTRLITKFEQQKKSSKSIFTRLFKNELKFIAYFLFWNTNLTKSTEESARL